jgi:hypothetical protein
MNINAEMLGTYDWFMKHFFTPGKVMGLCIQHLDTDEPMPMACRRIKLKLGTKWGRTSEYIEIPEKREVSLGRIIVQRHRASHLHYDVSIFRGKSKTDVIRFVVSKKELGDVFPASGKGLTVIQQPNHTLEYCAKDHHDIPAGEYGAGKVDKVLDETILIHKQQNNELQFSMYGKDFSGKFALFHLPEKYGQHMWKFTVRKDVVVPDIQRHEYKAIRSYDHRLKGHICEEKADGNNESMVIKNNGTIILKGTRPKVDGTLPDHSAHAPHITQGIRSELGDTQVHGELVHRKGLPFLSGILNSKPTRAWTEQQTDGRVSLRVFDISRYKGRDVTHLPYSERRRIYESFCKEFGSKSIKPVRKYANHTAAFHVEKEGVVFKDPNAAYKSEKWIKWKKIGVDEDLKIVGIEPIGKSKLSSGSKWLDSKGNVTGAGKFIVERNGTEVKVGTGISDEMRRDAIINPNKYIGSFATVVGMEETESGSIRAPVFHGIHESKSPDFVLMEYAERHL